MKHPKTGLVLPVALFYFSILHVPNPYARMLLLVFLALAACREQPDPVTTFLGQHGSDDFSVFTRTALFVRGFDRDLGEAIVFLYKPTADGFGVYRYHLVRRRSRFVKAIMFRGGRSVFSAADTALIQQFMPLNVTRLEVDPRGTVDVVVQAYSPQIRLIKTGDIVTAARPGETFTAKGGSWYESRKE